MQKTPPSLNPGRSNKTDVMLSAFVCPGLGQYFQGRWFAAAFYLGTILALLFLLIWIALVPVYRNVYALLLASDPSLNVDLSSISSRNVALTLAGVLLIYFLNVLDVVIVDARRMRARRRGPTPPDLPGLKP